MPAVRDFSFETSGRAESLVFILYSVKWTELAISLTVKLSWPMCPDLTSEGLESIPASESVLRPELQFLYIPYTEPLLENDPISNISIGTSVLMFFPLWISST